MDEIKQDTLKLNVESVSSEIEEQMNQLQSNSQPQSEEQEIEALERLQQTQTQKQHQQQQIEMQQQQQQSFSNNNTNFQALAQPMTPISISSSIAQTPEPNGDFIYSQQQTISQQQQTLIEISEPEADKIVLASIQKAQQQGKFLAVLKGEKLSRTVLYDYAISLKQFHIHSYSKAQLLARYFFIFYSSFRSFIF